MSINQDRVTDLIDEVIKELNDRASIASMDMEYWVRIDAQRLEALVLKLETARDLM